jgi:hypothetical protein
MTLKFKIKLLIVYAWGFLTNRVPIYVRDSSDTVIAFASKHYDPWTDVTSLRASVPRRGLCVLNENGTVSDYNFLRWVYVDPSRRVIQTLIHN